MAKNKIIVNNNTRLKGTPKGVTPESLKSIVEKTRQTIAKKQKSIKVSIQSATRQNMGRLIKNKVAPGIRLAGEILTPRPPNKQLTSILSKVTTLDLPEEGSFNAGLAKFPDRDEYILVYRPNEYRFFACILDSKLNVKKGSFFKFSMSNCADPRLIWTPDNKLLMVYSSTSEVGLRYECIRGCIIMDLNVSEKFIDAPPFRISPSDLTTRQKNWMPFIHNGSIFLVASICPHIIYELKIDGTEVHCEQKFETDWVNPWMFNEFLRGNTNIVQLDDGNYLGTFHTAVWHQKRCFYDNGAYVFEGKPPFKVLKCANRTYLKAEDAIAPHYRKKNLIVCVFPVGMVKVDNRLLISYGDNDTVVKIMETTTDKMLNLMLDVY